MNANEIAAGHRTIIRRAWQRACGGTDAHNRIQYDTSAADLDQWAKDNPEKLAHTLERWFERAAREWTTGNNSGDNRTFDRCKAECDRLHAQAESVLALFGIKVDYPGLYPCFEHDGRHFYTAEELSRLLNELAIQRKVGVK